MKKLFGFLVLIIGLTIPILAQNGSESNFETTPQGKHQQFDQYFGISVGSAGMRMNDSGILTADFGVNYGFYIFNWLSLNTGVLFHTELYFGNNLLTGTEPMQTPLCFTIPFGFHFNIPKVEWLYTGASFAVNIPIADYRTSGERNSFSENNVFFSLPIDIGIDFIKPNRGGSRLLFRVTPTFHKSDTIVPVGVIWQIYNWRVFHKTVDVKVDVNVEVNVPPPPVINVPR